MPRIVTTPPPVSHPEGVIALPVPPTIKTLPELVREVLAGQKGDGGSTLTRPRLFTHPAIARLRLLGKLPNDGKSLKVNAQ